MDLEIKEVRWIMVKMRWRGCREYILLFPSFPLQFDIPRFVSEGFCTRTFWPETVPSFS